MNIFEQEIVKKYEMGYVEGMEFYKRKIYRKLVEGIYKGYQKEMIEELVELGGFDEIEVQKAYNYIENYSYARSPLSGYQLGKYIDWRLRSEIVIPTDKMNKSVYLRLTSAAASGTLANFISKLVESYSEFNHVRQAMYIEIDFVKQSLKEYKKLLEKGKLKTNNKMNVPE